MPFWSKQTDKSSQEGMEEDSYNEQPAGIAVQPGTPSGSMSRNDGEPKPSCFRRFCSEMNPCQPWFTTADTFGRKVDIPESFSPASCYAFAWKLAATALTIATLAMTWIDTDNPEFYLAYLTYWGLLISALYLLCSTYNTVMASRTPQPPVAAGFIIRTTWVLATMATHTEACASILWWVLIYDAGVTEITFYNITPHLIIALVVWFDAFVVNRIPMRWMMWFGFILPLDISWIAWSVIQSYAGIGNPDNADVQGAVDDANDDAIYAALAWKDEWLKSLIISLIAVFGLGSVIFMLMWLCSLYMIPCACYKDKRKYMDSYRDQEDPRPTVDDVEEGSIFARWR